MAQSRFAKLSQVKLHYLEDDAGGGEVVVLLHGWPHTSHTWRHVIPRLSKTYRIIAPDMHGLGDSSRPAHGYDNGTVASDVVELLDLLGVDTFHLVGHDWGGPVAFAATLLARDRVRKLALVDAVLAGDGRAAGSGQGGARWHHLFHRTPHLPEALTAGRESIYLSLCLSKIKSEHIRGANRRGLGGKEYALPSSRCAIGARPYPRPSVCASHYSSERKISESGADVPRLRQ
jgi:pimeloyl-ACP methyl ester carboxylesterase